MPPNGALEGAPLVGVFQLTTPARTFAQKRSYSSGLPPIRRGGEAVARGIGLGDRGVEIGDADDLQDRPEQFGVGRRSTSVTSIKAGREEGQLVADAVEAADRLAALAHQIEERLLEMVGGFIVDHRAHERRRVGMGMVDDQPVDQAGDDVDQLLMLAVLDDQPPRGGAALAGAEIGRLHRHRRGGMEILGVPDTSGLLPPISSARIFCGVSANWRWSARPARAEPVNRRPSRPELAASALPTSGPPWTQRTTPSGTPASW